MTQIVRFLKNEVNEQEVIDAYFELSSDDGIRLHSIQIEPISDLNERLAALRSSSVRGFGLVDVSDEEWAHVVAKSAEVHTPEVKAAYEAWKAAQLAAVG